MPSTLDQKVLDLVLPYSTLRRSLRIMLNQNFLLQNSQNTKVCKYCLIWFVVFCYSMSCNQEHSMQLCTDTKFGIIERTF